MKVNVSNEAVTKGAGTNPKGSSHLAAVKYRRPHVSQVGAGAYEQ
jgi:hypothetical protein